MDNHILFFIVAGLLILVLVGWSLWSARREKSRVFSNTFSTRPPATTGNQDPNGQNPLNLNPQNTPSFVQDISPVSPPAHEQQAVEQNVQGIRITLQDQAPPQESELQETATNQPLDVPQTGYYTEQQPYPTAEPVEVVAPTRPETETQPQTAENNENNMITLYVVAAEGYQFFGENIVRQLETLGFHYGEYEIFHRHIDHNNSPILFSAANMMQPGIFNLNKISELYTPGLVFFMQLPSTGSNVANLRLMMRTVDAFAEAMNGFVLDDQFQEFKEESRQQYLLRVSQA